MGFEVEGLRLRVWGSGFGVQGSEYRVQDLGSRIWGSCFRLIVSGIHLCGMEFWSWCIGCRAQDCGCWGLGFGLGVWGCGFGVKM